MKLTNKQAAVSLVCAVLAMAFASPSILAADEDTGTPSGVRIRVLDQPFSGDSASLAGTAEKTSLLDQQPLPVSGYPVLESHAAVVACSTRGGVLTFWARQGDQFTRQGDVLLSSTATAPQLRLVRDERAGVALEIEDAQPGLKQLVALSPDGILEIRQPPDRTVSVRSTLSYVLVPSLVGTDLLYDPQTLPVGEPNYLVSLNMVVGLQAGGGGMLIAVWPPGDQLARVCAENRDGQRVISPLELDTAGQGVFVSFINHANLWHALPLRDAYLETDTAIKWQRPFEARWIGRFFIDSDEYEFPFYFLSQRHKLWGRYIRGWFYYPVWFDGKRTMVHFEKKFPPLGELLIYYLDTYDGKQVSAVSVMQSSLGKEAAARLLDFPGTRDRPLLEHGNAVCAMTYKIEAYFAQEAGAAPWAEVMLYGNDIATFIRLIRERVFEFDRFAVELQDLLRTQQQQQPALASSLEPCEEILAEIRDIVAADLPGTSLEEVGQWTSNIQSLSLDDRQQGLATVKDLTQKCRSVAGTQDDMARDLCVVTIRLMQEGARMGTGSSEHVRVAEQIIARCRQVLRQPTWWEPSRKYMPKSNPGAPSGP